MLNKVWWSASSKTPTSSQVLTQNWKKLWLLRSWFSSRLLVQVLLIWNSSATIWFSSLYPLSHSIHLCLPLYKQHLSCSRLATLSALVIVMLQSDLDFWFWLCLPICSTLAGCKCDSDVQIFDLTNLILYLWLGWTAPGSFSGYLPFRSYTYWLTFFLAGAQWSVQHASRCLV